MNTKLILLLVALTGQAVLSRPDSYESYEYLGLSSPYGSSSEEDSAEIALQESFQISYDPHKDGQPEAHFEKLKAKLGIPIPPEILEQFKAQYQDSLGKPLPEPTAEQLAKIDMDLNISELKRINELRALHGSPPLTYNEKLAAFAQNYAEEISAKMENGAKFKHNPETKIYIIGENQAGDIPQGPVWPQYKGHSANMWYFGEIDTYKHNGNRRAADGDPNQTGHFTQVVWQETKEVGCGSGCFKKGGRKECNIICNFYPAGNTNYPTEAETDEEFAKNVNMDIDEQAVAQRKAEIDSPILLESFKQYSLKRGY